jgi:hypothetical protein
MICGIATKSLRLIETREPRDPEQTFLTFSVLFWTQSIEDLRSQVVVPLCRADDQGLLVSVMDR